jgi:hypothetical protein
VSPDEGQAEPYVNERFEIDPQYLAELRLIGDMLSDAGILQPGVAFAVYRKRRA